jgi:hypothetical protein
VSRYAETIIPNNNELRMAKPDIGDTRAPREITDLIHLPIIAWKYVHAGGHLIALSYEDAGTHRAVIHDRAEVYYRRAGNESRDSKEARIAQLERERRQENEDTQPDVIDERLEAKGNQQEKFLPGRMPLPASSKRRTVCGAKCESPVDAGSARGFLAGSGYTFANGNGVIDS